MASVVIWSFAIALPGFWTDFKGRYDPPPASALAKAECLTCHVKRGQRAHNAYGSDVWAAMQKSQDDLDVLAGVAAVDRYDSDGDGFANSEEIAKGFLPGDAASRPSGEPVAKPEPRPRPEAQKAAVSRSLVPAHSFHPQVVHFPVALFIFGALLELIGSRKQSPAIRQAGYWNMLAGTVATALAIPTGLLATFREGYGLAFGTPVFLHFALAVAATLAMVGIVLWRRRREPVAVGYFIAIILCSVLLGVAAHFGGALVYD